MLWVFFSGATSICNAVTVRCCCGVIAHTKSVTRQSDFGKPAPGAPLEQKEVGWWVGALRWHPWTRWAEAG